MTDWADTLLRVLLDSSLRIALIAFAVAGILSVMGVGSGAVRHAAWTAVLCAMLLMPILPNVVPVISIPVPRRTRPVSSPAPIAPAPASPTANNFDQVASDMSSLRPSALAAEVTPSPPIWPYALAAVYGIGVVLLVLRLLAGWRAMRLVANLGKRVHGLIHVSDLVATPITAGILSPSLIVPAAWRSWPISKRRAILAHEIAHIRRHDPLIGFLAHLNCCFFWFHPLAWWLERKLAATAEHACDDAAVIAIHNSQAYAGILLDMARAVHRRGGRLSWQGIGVEGNGLLAERIERICRHETAHELSIARKTLLALSCAAVIVLVVACHQLSRPTVREEQQALARVRASELRFREEISRENVLFRRIEPFSTEMRNFTPEQASEIESRLAKRPEDYDTRLKLLFFYSGPFAAQREKPSPEVITARRKHILWLIHNSPEDDLLRSPFAFINVAPVDPLADPEGYAQAKQLWLAYAERPDASAAGLSNAAYLLLAADKSIAETLLVRARGLEPVGPWTARFGRLYASMILGATAVRPPINEHFGNFVVLSVSAAEARSPDAGEARRKLASSGDDALLTTVAQILLMPRSVDSGFDSTALAKEYLERAAALNPRSEAKRHLEGLRIRERQARIRELPKEGRYEAATLMSDRDKFELLWELAKHSYYYGDSFEHREDARREWEKSRKYAADLAEVAPRFRSDPEYGAAIFNANALLGFVAVEEGDTANALRYLREAMNAPNNPEMTDWPNNWPNAPWPRLCSALIDEGYENDVIEFLEHFAETDSAQGDELLAAAAQIRNGGRPRWYRKYRRT